MLLIARIDAESGKLISSNVDIEDHDHILGTTVKATNSLAEAISEAEGKGASAAEVNNVEKTWTEHHKLSTFNEGILLLFTVSSDPNIC